MNTAATAKKAPAARKPKAATKPATAKAGTGKGKNTGQAQSALAADVADATSTTPKAPPAASPVVRGGTLNVPIEVMAIPSKPYSARAVTPEDYPFSKLDPATKTKDGEIVGPSFFIPDVKLAEQKLATARKRHRKAGLLFWSRKTMEKKDGKGQPIAGLRIWRGTPTVRPK